MAAAQSLLRRWKPFYGAFACVDAAIEAADPDLCRDEFRRTRGDIVELLCDATDDGQAERLCGILDEVMAEALETLRLVPAMAKMLASTDLAKAVCELREHDSERVRLLASGIVSAWKASVQDGLHKARAAMEKLNQTPPLMEIVEPPAKKTASTTKIAEPLLPAKSSTMGVSTKAQLSSKNATPPVGIVRGHRAVRPCSDDAKMANTKRKLHEGYQEAQHVKRHRKIQVVEASEMTRQRQRQRNMHPIMRERSRTHCASSMIKRTISVSRLRTI